MTLFLSTSQRSEVYNLPSNCPSRAPRFQFVWKHFVFKPCFDQNSSFQDGNFLNFCSQEFPFFKENLLLNPTFGNPSAHTHNNKKLRPPQHSFALFHQAFKICCITLVHAFPCFFFLFLQSFYYFYFVIQTIIFAFFLKQFS